VIAHLAVQPDNLPHSASLTLARHVLYNDGRLGV
jgi:hypothetical protein